MKYIKLDISEIDGSPLARYHFLTPGEDLLQHMALEVRLGNLVSTTIVTQEEARKNGNFDNRQQPLYVAIH